MFGLVYGVFIGVLLIRLCGFNLSQGVSCWCIYYVSCLFCKGKGIFNIKIMFKRLSRSY